MSLSIVRYCFIGMKAAPSFVLENKYKMKAWKNQVDLRRRRSVHSTQLQNSCRCWWLANVNTGKSVWLHFLIRFTGIRNVSTKLNWQQQRAVLCCFTVNVFFVYLTWIYCSGMIILWVCMLQQVYTQMTCYASVCVWVCVMCVITGVHSDHIRRAILWLVWAARTSHVLW